MIYHSSDNTWDGFGLPFPDTMSPRKANPATPSSRARPPRTTSGSKETPKTRRGKELPDIDENPAKAVKRRHNKEEDNNEPESPTPKRRRKPTKSNAETTGQWLRFPPGSPNVRAGVLNDITENYSHLFFASPCKKSRRMAPGPCLQCLVTMNGVIYIPEPTKLSTSTSTPNIGSVLSLM